MSKEIPLTSGMVAIVDEKNYEKLSEHKWHVQRAACKLYARTNISIGDGKYRGVFMHRMILNSPREHQVDHINGDSLDNRESNLRLCSQSENLRNRKKTKVGSSIYKGVHWDGRDNRWVSKIKKDRKRFSLGTFRDEVEAAQAYDKAAREYHGEFARVNFVPAMG